MTTMEDVVRYALLSLASSLLGGCYLFHGTAGDEASVSASDAGPPGEISSGDSGADSLGPREVPPDASIFVSDDVDLPIERPSGELTCDNGHEALIASCGALRVLHVAAGGREGASGGPADPHGSLEAAFVACSGAACELRLASGELAMPVELEIAPPRCLWISGGWERSETEWSVGDARTGVHGGGVGAERIVVERIDFDVEYGAIGGSELLVVRDVSIVSGYNGVSTGPRGTRICRTRIQAEYSGISVSSGSSDVVIEDVDIDAGYSGVDVSWGASSIVIRNSRVRGDYSGVDVSWDSHDIVVEGSTIDGGYVGVGVSHGSHGVLISESTVGGCHEPVSVSHGSHTVKITNDTATGPCTGEPYEAD